MTASGLHIKTYFSSTVEAAFTLARRELGPEAMLLNSRLAPEEARHLGRYEVVFATVPEKEEEISHPAPSCAATPQEASSLPQQLEQNGVEPTLVREIAQAAQANSTQTSGTADSELFRKAVLAEMEARLKVDPSVGVGGKHRVAALIGPPGRGKTTTLVKLAIAHGLAMQLPVRILAAGHFEVGGVDQLRTYAKILKADFESVENTPALERALSAPPNLPNPFAPSLTLIDTPGYGAKQMDAASGLARCLEANPEVDIHLVLRADARAADLLRTVERFRMFQPRKLIFTGLDEVESLGNLFSVAAQTRLPISFLGTGQEIPEDLQFAKHRQITGYATENRRLASRAAA